LPKAGSFEVLPSVFGRGDDHITVVELEDFKVLARHSSNAGTTFDPAISLAGGSGQPDAQYFRAAQGADGRIVVAIAIVDPLGGIGLQVATTADMGQTWSGPTDLIRYGNPLHDIRPSRQRLAIAVGANGRAAIMFADENAGYFYVVATSDGGA